MCGLVGMMGALEGKHRDVMNNLLFLDSLRGTDSTGVAAVDRQRKVQLRKMTVPGYEFIQMGFINNLMGFGDQLWLGHNRFKTRGSVTRVNAHPFEVVDDEGYITTIGAHNGTLDNQWEIENELGNNKRFGTDSEALINLIDRVGPKEAISKARGAWSLTFWNAKDNELCFLRNDKRPMYYAYTKDRKVLVWASEVWMILAACNRNNVELAANENGISVYSTAVDTLYRFKIPQGKTEIDAPVKEGGLLGAPEKAPFQGGYSGSRWSGLDDDDIPFVEGPAAKQKTEKKTEEAGSTTSTQGNVITLGTSRVKGFDGKFITPQERDEVAAAGCGWCGGKIKDPKSMAWVAESEAICDSCNAGGAPLTLTTPREKLSVKKG